MSRVIYWFRTDLRLHDSPALDAALKLKPDVMYPVWCWDPEVCYSICCFLDGYQKWSEMGL